jgi:hypothetical protein
MRFLSAIPAFGTEPFSVMAGLGPAIHDSAGRARDVVDSVLVEPRGWPGRGPAMTVERKASGMGFAAALL